jgi:hypothetical protein
MKHFRICVGDVEGRASSSDRSMLFRPFESSAILSGIVDVTINEFPGAFDWRQSLRISAESSLAAETAKWCLAAYFEVTARFLIKNPKPLIMINIASGAMCNILSRTHPLQAKNQKSPNHKVIHTPGARQPFILLALNAFVVWLRRDQIAKLIAKLSDRQSTRSEPPTNR